MRHFLISVFEVLIILTVIFAGGGYYVHSKSEGLEATVDNINAKVKAKDVFAAVTRQGEKMRGDQYRYRFDGYDKNGKRQKITVVTNKKLRKGIYLKIYTKGNEGKGWYKVKESKIPKKALQKLNNHS
ncbi:YxeA family protein [Scopulibacillus cellulosilyticus]|uniref:YxeA family protein n=1 Tax=Scopulibacillus cellulosilyticus TaxID=2665665 RepID=A0ABW2PXL4_9BACL